MRTKVMDLKTFNFPTGYSTFSEYKTDKALLAEAKERGFYGGHTPYNKLFSELFFYGGKIEFKKGLDENFKQKAWPYCRRFMQSWAPKHEEKEAICAMLMSELLEPTLLKKEPRQRLH